MNKDRPVRVRIAPSPTGDPHVGTAYIGLFNYVFARKNKGSLILRVEDTDQVRSSREAEEAIFQSLRWTGLQWDEGPDVGGPHGPYRQSERLSIYQEHIETLLDSGHAYRCTCTPERLSEVRARQRAEKQDPRYDGHCRNRPVAEVAAEIASGASSVVRLKVPRDGVTILTDALRGDIEFENSRIDDQVLQKGDGFPTYHLANVVDDYLMGVSHVIRGEEWISSTPKHLLLYRAFDWPVPTFAHLPLLRNADKSKVSKRKNPISLVWYQQAGILPQALLNFLGMMGWTMPDGEEVFSVDDMTREFTLERIHLGGPVFDVKKLIWLNGKYIREQLSDQQQVAHLRDQVVSEAYLSRIVPLVKERIDKFEDFFSYASFFFCGSLDYVAKELLPKKLDEKATAKILAAVADAVDLQSEWNHASVEQLLRDYCEKSGMKPRDVFMPVRVAVTGKKATPPLFETMEVLGRELCRRRMRDAAAFLRTLPKKSG